MNSPITVHDTPRNTTDGTPHAPPPAPRTEAGHAAEPPTAALRTAAPPPTRAAVTDLRHRAGRSPHRLRFAAGDLVVVSGLPGSGKSTLMRRTVPDARVDSQDTRDRFSGRLPRRLPYAVYRPLVRLVHYLGLRRRLRAGTGLVVHDCGTQAWVRRWLGREAARRDRTLHLLLLDVAPEVARAGQGVRGRRVSRYAFHRHRRAVARLLAGLTAGRLPVGCTSAVLLDRAAADALRTIGFGAE